MSLAKLFWILAVLNIVFIALAALGYPVIIVVAVLLLVDIMMLEVNRQTEKQKLIDEVKSTINSLSDKIESAVSKMTGSGNENLVEARLRQHENNISSQLDTLRSFIRADIKDALDKMAGKMIHIENKLNQTKKTLGAAVAVFDERMGAIESDEPEDEPVGLEPTDEL